jgi:hypothetical protein
VDTGVTPATVTVSCSATATDCEDAGYQCFPGATFCPYDKLEWPSRPSRAALSCAASGTPTPTVLCCRDDQ